MFNYFVNVHVPDIKGTRIIIKLFVITYDRTHKNNKIKIFDKIDDDGSG